MAEQTDGLICACILDGKGGGREVGWDGIEAWRPEDGFLWVHLDWTAPDAVAWVSENVTEPGVAETLLAEETRPRAVAYGDSLLVTLRGVNLNPQSDPEDMVSVRIWIDGARAVTTRHRRIMAVNDVRERLGRGTGPKDAGDFLTAIADRLVERMGPTLEGLDNVIDDLEAEVLEDTTPESGLQRSSQELRRSLARVRRQAIELRRYLAPQRDAMTRLQLESVGWQAARHRVLLREVSDTVTRYIEDLEALRDRGAVVQDELRNRLSEDMNRTMYVLTVVAAVLLPLTFITGLLGINVDGIPGAQNSPYAFELVIAILAGIAALQVWLFRRLRWI